MVDAKTVLKEITLTLRKAFPEKIQDVILHGSHLDGTAREDSDYDFIIVWDGEVGYQLKKKIVTAAYDTDLKFGVLSHLIIIGKEELNSVKGRQPLFQEALAGGLRAAL